MSEFCRVLSIGTGSFGTGLSILEMCALYFSRSLLQTLGGAPFEEEMNRAFAKLERALPAASRRFLDQMPRLIKTKARGRKKHDDRKSREVLARVLDASLSHRRVDMRYHSASSQRTKDYVIEPLRVSCADGGIYVTAWVPEYDELRTFALERIQNAWREGRPLRAARAAAGAICEFAWRVHRQP
jgi:predicted DNA-binding transcriptional regulator YafY